MVTRENLAEIIPLRAEIADLERRLSEQEVRVSVQSSGKDFPYAKHSAILEGLPPSSDKLLAELQSAKKRLFCRLQWIEGISDRMVKLIVRMRYVEGLSWQKIAFNIGEYDEQVPRKKVLRFLKLYEKYEKGVL